MALIKKLRRNASIAQRFFLGLIIAVSGSLVNADDRLVTSKQTIRREAHRSPVDLVLTHDGQYLLTANQTSDSVSLVRLADRKVVQELSCGRFPSAIVGCRDRQHFLVSCAYSGEVLQLKLDGDGLQIHRRYELGYEPIGIAVHPVKPLAYVALAAAAQVVEIDLDSGAIGPKIEVGKWPRYVALSSDGSRLAVGCSGESKIYVVDTEKRQALYDEVLSGGINIGHMQSSRDGTAVYFPWMIYRTNPINVRNIQLGWVLASRIGRVRLDGPAYREAISLDVPRLAIADPHGLAISPNEHRLVVSASGTHELLVYRLNDLPFVGTGGPGDLIDRRLLADQDLFYRIELGGRPMNIAFAADNRTVLVANHLKDAVQIVDIEHRKIIDEIHLGSPNETSLARKGMEIFYDGRRSLDQWYSCHTCHYQGGINAKAMDTTNDGSDTTLKTVLPLANVHKTSPWTWHGWQTDLQAAMQKSFTSTMQGKPINDEDMRAVLAYLESLDCPPNPHRGQNNSLSEAALRGRTVFESKKAGCVNCHNGPYYTDGQVHDVGLGSANDRYSGYNTPSLVNVYRKVRYLHDGRSKSLEDVLTGPHAPEKVTREGSLADEELSDLIAYLKSL